MGQTTKFDGRKIAWVVGALVVTIGGPLLLLVLTNDFKAMVLAGLIIAFAGKLSTFFAKTDEIQSSPRTLDGFNLFAHAITIFGLIMGIFAIYFGLESR